MKDANCIFCKIIDGGLPSTKVYESDNVLAFLDVNPVEKGHVLVVPKRHWPTIADVPVSNSSDIRCAEELMYIMRVVAKAVNSSFADGVNILQANGGCAGQTVPHLHFHVIPRYGKEPVQPVWRSGAGKYSEDEERDIFAKRISEAVKVIIAEEQIVI